jgi:hypothetical protein
MVFGMNSQEKIIIGLAFGQGKPDENGRPMPGKSNEALAEVVKKLCEKENCR